VGDRIDHHVVLPTRVRPAFEMIEAEFGLEMLIVLFDRPGACAKPLILDGGRSRTVIGSSSAPRRGDDRGATRLQAEVHDGI
jgi:hypothetical protein